ncbi:MAG: hypothetical protein GC181_12765 [Bacteroidetes bacterium]|nr:hypothetical protein [Bacteroidota bacterium]
MKVIVNVNEEQISHLLDFLEENKFEWMNEEELSDAHKAIIDKRLDAIEGDPSRLRPVDDFFRELSKSL